MIFSNRFNHALDHGKRNGTLKPDSAEEIARRIAIEQAHGDEHDDVDVVTAAIPRNAELDKLRGEIDGLNLDAADAD